MKIAVASDHAGFTLKEAVRAWLTKQGHEARDFGCRSTEAVDLPDFAYPAALALSQGEVDRAILVDGAGYPSAMIANCLSGVFAAVANDPLSARYSREHSDANALCLGGKVIGEGMGLECVEIFLRGEFLGGKYARRRDKIREIAARHRLSPEMKPLNVLTVEELREAILRRRPLWLTEKTLLSPSVEDVARHMRA